jgi:hypothetical protein
MLDAETVTDALVAHRINVGNYILYAKFSETINAISS